MNVFQWSSNSIVHFLIWTSSRWTSLWKLWFPWPQDSTVEFIWSFIHMSIFDTLQIVNARFRWSTPQTTWCLDGFLVRQVVTCVWIVWMLKWCVCINESIYYFSILSMSCHQPYELPPTIRFFVRRTLVQISSHPLIYKRGKKTISSLIYFLLKKINFFHYTIVTIIG